MAYWVKGYSSVYEIAKPMTAQSAQGQQPAAKPESSVQTMVNKIVELQDKLVDAQEKNLVLSTQLRELEMMARDGQDLNAELSNQSALLADKSRENKQLHQDLARVTALLEQKLKEVEELQANLSDIQHQLRQRESERDLLAVMLTEKEKEVQSGAPNPRSSGSFDSAKDNPNNQGGAGWFNKFKK